MEDYRLEQSGQEVQDILNGAAKQTDLTAETERAELAETTLQGNIDDEETRAKAAEKQNADDIDAIEEKIPSGASSANKFATQSDVSDEELARQQADQTLDGKIDAEELRAKAAEKQNADDIDALEEKIPAGASSSNKLATEAYVNDKVATDSATFRGTFNLVSDLGLVTTATHNQIAAALLTAVATADNNDYAFVQVPTSAETPTQIAKIERYKFDGSAWAFEYELNNSGFTSNQWAAINSGITSGDVTKLAALPTNAQLTTLLNGKQDALTFDNVPTQGSNNPVKSGGVYSAIDEEKGARRNSDEALEQSIAGITAKIPDGASSSNKMATESEITTLSAAIEAILALIPSAATALNQLADKAFVNSSIATASATFRGTFNLVSDLHLAVTATHAQIATMLASVVSTADSNDYCFVQIPTSADTPAEIRVTERYKYDGSAWVYEYDLNNSGFTASQWDAINSAITSALVTKLSALPTASELATSLAGKQNTLTFDNVPVNGSNNPVKSGGLYELFAAIDAKFPSDASANNKLVAENRLASFVSGIINALDATFDLTSADGHVTFKITQADGLITSVQILTSDIASAQALTTLGGQVSTNASDIAALQDLYNALQQSAPEIIQPSDTWPVANPSTTVIYRVIDRVNTPPEYYSDYMFKASDLTTPVLMATYNNAIDPRPKKGSANLVTSGGVFDNMGALDVSELNATEGPHTLATYAELSAALAAIPSDYQKGGMSIKFVCSSDNKYVQYLYHGTSTAVADFTNTGNWEKVNLEKEVDAISDVLYNEDPNHQLVQHFASGGIRMSSFADAVPFELKAGRYTISASYTIIDSLSCYLYDSEGTNILGSGITIQNLVGGKVFESDIARIGFYGSATSEGDVTITFVDSNPKEGLIDKVGDMEDILSNIDETPTEDSPNLVTSGGVAAEISRLDSSLGGMEDSIEDLREDMDDLVGTSDTPVDLSTYIAAAKNGIISFTDGTWVNRTSSYKHIMLPVEAGNTYSLLAKVDGTLSLRYALLQSDDETGTSPDYCEGWTLPKASAKGTAVDVFIPEDCTYIYFEYIDNGDTADLSVVLKGEEGGRVGALEEEMGNVIGTDDSPINLAPYIADAHNGIIVYATGAWGNVTSANKHIVIPAIAGRTYKLLASNDGALSLRYAPLKSYSGVGSGPDYCTGYTTIIAVAKGTETEFTAPSDCTCIYLCLTDNNNTAVLSATLEGLKGELNELEERVDDVANGIWAGKNIAWYGTSIPAGTSLAIPFKGNPITALLAASTVGRFPSGRIVETDGEECPHEYPIMVGSLLNADVYNQAVGSSKAGKSYVGSKTDLYLYCKSLANSVKDILDVISNCYTIDWVNHTVTRNGSNDYGITSFFSTDIENSWNDFCGKVLECVSFSYEIAIVSRYLISDDTEHTSYVQGIFGTYYSSVVENLDLDALCGFKADIDMFVFDHGCNDGKWASSSTTPISEGILSNDPTTFEGAYNLFFNTIYRYKANARIVVIGSYYNWQPNAVVNKIDVQKAIAERWQFPFIDMSKFMPAAINITVLTNGYWEDVSRSGVTMGKWHERGFTYDNSTGENNNDMFSHYHLTQQQIESTYEPQQIDGIWYWKAPMMKLWCYDEPHPHSDSEGRMSKILTRLLSAHLDDIGNI